MARYTGPKLKQTTQLEYGLARSNNARHHVMFQAMEYMAPSTLATGTATEPTNDPRNILVVRPPMKRTVGVCRLYLPAQINVSQKSNYGEPEMGAAVAATINASKNFTGMNGDSAKAVGGSLVEAAKTAGTKIAASAVDVVATGAKAAEQISSGITRNNSTELMFEGVDRRSFSFSFKMIPHNASEATAIQEIVQYFRFHMAPHIPEGTQYGQALAAPSSFNITYNQKESTLHRISDCVLESIDVKYGGERPQFHHDNRPTETEITLQFKELEIITKKRIAEGY